MMAILPFNKLKKKQEKRSSVRWPTKRGLSLAAVKDFLYFIFWMKNFWNLFMLHDKGMEIDFYLSLAVLIISYQNQFISIVPLFLSIRYMNKMPMF